MPRGRNIPRAGTGQAIGLAAVLATLAACSINPPSPLAPPQLDHVQAGVALPEVELLEVTPEMQAFLERYVLPYDNPDTRLDLLTLALGRHGALGFRYDAGRSMSAAEAFMQRSGNCLSFANLLVAMARRAGLQAEYQQVFVPRDWTSRDNTIVLEKHVNVIVSGRHQAYVMDISGQDPGPGAHRQVLSDAEARALYYNNLGVEALLAGDLPTAHAWISRAIGTAPGMASPWVNLGVVLGRNGQQEDAAFAYQAALRADPTETAALSNLYEIYLARGELERAAEVQQRVERYRRQNPYYLLKLSDEAIAETRYQESLDLLKRALSKKQDDHVFHYALARSQYLAGEKAAAEESYRRARELAPGHLLARYEQPLPELIEESDAPPQ